jgi:hypothetical protein
METQTVFDHFGGVQAKVRGLGRVTANAWQELRIGSAPREYLPEICACDSNT